MKQSGYSNKQCRPIIESGIRNHAKKILKAREEERPSIHRDQRSSKNMRKVDKVILKNNWFRQKRKKEIWDSENYIPRKKQKTEDKDTRRVTSTIFVDRTPGRQLVKELRDREQLLRAVCSTKIRVMEKNGSSLRQLLQQGDPWAKDPCHRTDCKPFRTEGKYRGNCSSPNLVYISECMVCLSKGLKSQYRREQQIIKRKKWWTWWGCNQW